VFLAGDDAAAKDAVRALLADMGWADDEMFDLGGLSAARGLELYLPLWIAMRVASGASAFNIHVVRG
jgi:hypothetical protein